MSPIARALAKIEGAFIGWRLRALHAEATTLALEAERARWVVSYAGNPRGEAQRQNASLRYQLRQSQLRETALARAAADAIDAIDHPHSDDLGSGTPNERAFKIQSRAVSILEVALGRRSRLERAK